MREYRQTLIVLLLTILTGVAVAQNNTNSPYTRYGYGQLADPGSANSKAMGGVAYGLRDKYQVNFANPASYTSVDSLTFIFDGGISLQNTNFSNGTLKTNAKNSSVDYIAMQFRLAKWCGMSIGLMPFSNVGYSMSDYIENKDYPTNSASVTYSGEGGLHQVYVGTGFKIFKNFSLGANISYLWGDITHTRSESFPLNSALFPLTTQTNIAIKSYKLDFGVQYTQRFGKKHELTVGAVFSPGHDLNNESYILNQKGNSSTGTTTSQKDTVATFSLPMSVGVGLAYVYDGRLTVGIDGTLQNWNKTTFMNDDALFCKRAKFSIGGEYLPNPMGRSYLAHVKYRLGAYYSKPYYKIEGMRAAEEYGVTAGFGLPIPRTRSLLSITAQYVHVNGKTNAFLDENILRLCIGVTFNERWFFKWKVE